MRTARFVTLILTAHGSVDPRSAAVTHAVAGRIRRLRPWLDV
ncbi:sirohydrochlorin chelatase, partial [Mycolicibacterium elephantis]